MTSENPVGAVESPLGAVGRRQPERGGAQERGDDARRALPPAQVAPLQGSECYQLGPNSLFTLFTFSALQTVFLH